ncbi:MAG: hypothetical protein BWY76_03371 [bacterium ADurb.Bin429]|nr:MAG: hypothetical protein BWY76_03371 [bacterium ADurb.Bin429]
MLDDRQTATMPTEDAEALLSPEFLRKLEQLSLVLTRAFAGRMHGERRSTNRGQSVEFADFRTYSHGDDLRYVDWNVYARLEKLFLKLYVEEEDLHVHLLLDCSRSMGFGTPEKFLTARRVCAALGYIALNNLDRVSLTAVTDRLGPRLNSLRGKGNVFTLFNWLRELRAEGATDFAKVLKDYALLARRPGMVIIVSDFLAPGVEDGLRTLVGRRFAPTLLQVLAPEEITPPYAGDLRLVDAETGETREITVTSGLLQRYRQRLEAHQAYLADVSNRFGVNYVRTVTSEPFEQLILRYLKLRRVVA